MKVKDVMETDVITVKPDTSVRDVASLMSQHQLSALPVVDDEGRIIGIVSEKDLIYRLASPHLPPHIELLGGIIFLENPFEMKKEIEKMTAVSAKEIMTHQVLTVSPDTDVGEVATLMVEKDINGLPVVEEGKIIGIVTRHDLLLALSKRAVKVENKENNNIENE